MEIRVGYLLLPVLILVPFIVGPYNMHLLILALVFSVIVINWDLLIGFTGVWSFGPLVFFAIAGYGSGYLSLKTNLSPSLGPWIGLFFGCALAACLAVAVGVPTLRLKALYVSLFTMSLQQFMQSLVLQESLFNITGGIEGLYGIPPYQIGSLTFTEFNNLPYYFLALSMFLVSYFSLRKLLKSKVGMACAAMRDNETYCTSLGVNPTKYKLIAFVFSAIFTGAAGSFYAHYLGVMPPTTLNLSFLLTLIIMLIVGGMGKLYGPVVGAFLFTFLSEYLRMGGPAELLRLLVLSAIVVPVLMFMPKGLVQILEPVEKLKIRI